MARTGGFAIILVLLATWPACDEASDGAAPTATVEATVTLPAAEPTEPSLPTDTVEAPTDTPAPPEPTEPPITNRQSCPAIQGTEYLSNDERQWYLDNCTAPPPIPPPPAVQPQPPAQTCHPSYSGACLNPNASDYDCAGGSGNGPYYTGTVIVVGPDVFDLDRDGDTVGCE